MKARIRAAMVIALAVAFTLSGSALSGSAQAEPYYGDYAETAIADFFLGGSDIPPRHVVEREARLYRQYTGCDYVRALHKYGRDIDARRACHGLLFN